MDVVGVDDVVVVGIFVMVVDTKHYYQNYGCDMILKMKKLLLLLWLF